MTRHSADELTSAQLPNGCVHQRVEDFLCSRGVPFFAAVISTCDGERLPALAARARHDSRSCSTLVTLVGDLDCATAPLLQTCLTRIDGNLEVDCSGLDFVGAHGVKVLMDARARCERTEATFELLAPTFMLRRIFLVTGLVHPEPFSRLRHGLEGHRGAWSPSDDAVAPARNASARSRPI